MTSVDMHRSDYVVLLAVVQTTRPDSRTEVADRAAALRGTRPAERRKALAHRFSVNPDASGV